MKKIFLISFALLFVILMSPHQTQAQDEKDKLDPYTILRCGSEPDDNGESTDVCHIRYDIVNSVLRPSQTDTTTSNNPLVGLQKIANMIWAGVVKPASNIYALGTIYSVPYGDQVDKASLEDLTPSGLQDITVRNKKPMKYCVTSRLCVANPLTGKLAGNFITKRTWCTGGDIPGWVAQNDGTQRLASYTTGYENPSQNFTKPDIRVQKFTPPPCNERAEGDAIDQTTLTTIKENLFTEDDKTSIPYTITADMQTEETFTNKLGELITRFIAKFPVPATHVAGGKVPFAAHVLCNAAGCPNPSDLDPALDVNDEQKQTLREGGGWINSMYRSDGFDPNYMVGLNAKYLEQEFEALFTKANTADTTVYAMRRTEEAQTFANCNLLTEAEQNLPANSGFKCGKSWASQSSPQEDVPPSSPANTSAWARSPNTTSSNPISPLFTIGVSGSGIQKAIENAAKGRIPQCLLEGVGKIEGAYDGAYTCKPNECSAVGPFQITTGKGPNDCKACGVGYCPNALPYLRRGVTAQSLCNTDVAATAATDLLIGKARYFGTPLSPTAPVESQRRAIINAGDSYYGSGAPVGRLGGLSYGEWIYAHCTGETVPHVTHEVGKMP